MRPLRGNVDERGSVRCLVTLFDLLELPGESAVDDPALWEAQASWEIRERGLAKYGFRPGSWYFAGGGGARRLGLARKRAKEKDGGP